MLGVCERQECACDEFDKRTHQRVPGQSFCDVRDGGGAHPKEGREDQKRLGDGLPLLRGVGDGGGGREVGAELRVQLDQLRACSGTRHGRRAA